MTLALDTLLVATDFSRPAADATQRAVMLARNFGASRIVLLHALPRLRCDALKTAKRRAEAAGVKLGELAAALRAGTGLDVQQRIEAGGTGLVEAVLRYQDEADLLVLGSRDAHPLRELFFGGTAQRVLRRMRKPVLAVKRPPQRSYGRAVIATDPSADAAQAMAYAKVLAPSARMHLVQVYRSPYEGKLRYAGVADELIGHYRDRAREVALQRMMRLLHLHAPCADVRARVVHGHPAAQLLGEARELRADLVVAGRRNKSLLEELLYPGVSSELLARCECDVLVVP
ncbi:MAG TPA: universal stress protein [Burkholderiales bacterium]